MHFSGKIWLTIFGLASFFSACESAWCDGTWNLVTSDHCPAAENAADILDRRLEEKLAGQSLASRTIVKAVKRNIEKIEHQKRAVSSWSSTNLTSLTNFVVGFPTSAERAIGKPTKWTPPLLMHFSGPTGVGKTLSADIVAQSLFTGEINLEKELCGKLEFQMRAYATMDSAKIKSNFDEISKKVAEQLYYCPRSVILFDEIQSVSEELLDSVIDLFDSGDAKLTHTTQYVRKSLLLIDASYVSYSHSVSVSNCIVILISDLGSSTMTSTMDREQAKKAIEEEAQKRFIRSSKRALLQNVVPFLPLSVDELTSVATTELKQLGAALTQEYKGVWSGKLTWSKEVPRWMAEYCFNHPVCYEDGGRGIETIVEHTLHSLSEGALTDECSRSDLHAHVSYNNLDLYLHTCDTCEGPQIKARIDPVFSASEFREL